MPVYAVRYHSTHTISVRDGADSDNDVSYYIPDYCVPIVLAVIEAMFDCLQLFSRSYECTLTNFKSITWKVTIEAVSSSELAKDFPDPDGIGGVFTTQSGTTLLISQRLATVVTERQGAFFHLYGIKYRYGIESYVIGALPICNEFLMREFGEIPAALRISKATIDAAPIIEERVKSNA